MNTASRSYYKRFYRLAGLAVTVMMAVLTGSLVLGDSVRGSLADRVAERLGQTETIVQSGTGFMSDSILKDELIATAKGYLLIEGFVSSEGRMVPVTVWGGDEEALATNEALLNEELKKEIGLGTVILHLPSNSFAPATSPFISQNYTTQMRLQAIGIRDGKEGGNLLLHNEQMRPLNIFVKRENLAEAMGFITEHTKGPINVILSPQQFTADEFRKVWRPSFSGIQMQGKVVSSSRVFLPRNVTDSLLPEARYLAYFVNSLGNIPYSFVTATDQLKGDNAILSDYAARRMGVHIGDSVTMEYYVVKGLKRLETRNHHFVVSQIVPISQMADSLLTASFPGLSNADRCTDWDSDLPIDMSRITKADEDYWAHYRQTPKAIVSLDAVGNDWEGEYGVATKVVTSPECMSKLTPESMGISVVQPRAAALRAAQNGTDFASLFLSLGFFIILAAILLMQNPLMEMYHLRNDEIQLYSTLGFKRSDVFKRLYIEALPTILIATPIGLVLGYAYAALMLWLMAGIWNGATHTDGFTIHAQWTTLLWAWLAGILICLTVLWLTVRKGLKQKQYIQKKETKNKWLLISLFSVTGVLIIINFIIFHSMVLFIVCGLLWIICCGLIGQAFINREADDSLQPLPIISHLRYYQRQNHLAFWTLALGVFAVFAVGLNRPDTNHLSSNATGEYQLFAESHVPIQYDLNNPASRRHLSLADLDDDAHFLQLAKHTEDEASCWNLNQVAAPSVLGMDIRDIADFGIDTTKFADHTSLSVAIDHEALLWSMMKETGDTLTYTSNDGRAMKVVIATSYPTGVFHGNAIMPMEQFRSLWPGETGSKVLLVKTKEGSTNTADHDSTTMSVSTLLSSALSDYGVTLTSTADRLRRFFEVTDAYLSIFMSLGGLGLLLGLASLLIVIRKNIAARQQETELYKTLGFSTDSIVRMFRREQSIVPLYAIFTGTTGSLISISANARGVSPSIWFFALALLLLLLFTTMVIIQISINPKTIQK